MCDNNWILIFSVITIVVLAAFNSITTGGWWKSIKDDYNKNGKDLSAITKSLLKFSFYIIIIGTVILFCVFFTFTFGDLIKFNEHTGHIGDTIGGILNPFIALAAVIVTGLAFYMQFQANKQVQDQFKEQERHYKLDKFENKLFKLVENYNNTVNQFKCVSRDSGEVFIGKDVFFTIHQEFKATLKVVQNFNEKNSYTCTQICNAEIESADMFLEELKITYIIVFYGVSEYGQKTIIEKLKIKYKKEYLENLTNYLSFRPEGFNEKPDILKEWESISATTVENRCQKQFIRYNNGHQSRLGHYYRQLFMIIKFIDGDNDLKYQEKWEHSKYLRSLFSNHEQIIFHLNSISILGHDWELNRTNNDEKWITKYDLIKNIPESYRTKYFVQTIYPDVEYEAGSETDKRQQLNLNYK